MKLVTFVSLILFYNVSLAQNSCFENEKNVATKNIFTENEWLQVQQDWDSQEPTDPGILNLLFAWKVYKDESSTTNSFKGDKRKHCYIGCRIAQAVSYETAVYVAWYKEKEDLTDCVESSLFELRDHGVTIMGADIGKQTSEPKACFDECSQIKKY